MRGGLNAPRRNTYSKYVPNTLDISSVSGGQPSREVAQLAGGRVLHREQVRDEQPDQVVAADLFRGDLLGLTQRGDGLGDLAEDLAGRAGISSHTLSRLERRPKASCRTRTLARLAAALGEDPASISPRIGQQEF